ncbi:polysaccharide biosynthesis protein [Vaginisenegalia massiliensis]|uniref:polysaccharide biosynthesis protein n=1 Tax=Vaginisenegalia massiliensis TaxID=2058294 RepID=UPI000F52F6C2|nr:nucleoside-diphosphate sugar epimerase/dehydratase [Vaginisenegalia massiliensis]
MNSSFGISKWLIELAESLSKTQRRHIWGISDSLSLILASFCSYLFFFNIIELPFKYYLVFTTIIVLGYNGLTQLLQLDAHIHRYLKIIDLIKLFNIILLCGIVSGIVTSLVFATISYRYILFSIIIGGLFVCGLRVIWMITYSSRFRTQVYANQTRVLVVGAGDGGSIFMDSYLRNPGNMKVMGILDQDPKKKGLTIGGIKVLGDRDLIPELVEELGIEQVIVAVPSMKPAEYEAIIAICNQCKLKVYKMPKVEDVLLGINMPNNKYKKVEIADLLGRPEIKLNEEKLRNELEGKTILVTGAGGSIGSEICRQISRFNPRRVLLLGHGENSIYLIYHELLKLGSMTEYVPIIADVQDYQRIIEVFKAEHPDIVYHAAAHKHVPMMEMNPREAYKNNILGTYNVAKAVDEAKVAKMVMISTDKAVNPPNVMGATKRVAELIITGFNQISSSTYCAVRFGNVLGSRGSVIPLFKKQIEEGGPVTVTDFRMTRYFMTIPEASRLVIHAGAFANGGEVFILDMGQPVKIVDLAKKLILLSGHSESEIQIVESGIRPGEKLYEELLTSSELVQKKLQDKIFIGKVITMPLEQTKEFIDSLSYYDNRQIKEKIIAFANQSAK